MAVKSRDVLKTYFENGDKPNEQQFSDLIDSLIHVNEGGGTNTNDGPTGTGIVDGITTDDDGNLVFTFVGGDTINITTNGSVGTVKMPIPYVDSYDNFYFVSEEKGDDDKAIPNSYRFYKSIVAASEAARADYDKTGNKNMVYVFKGTYNEESVNRNHVDMYFEDGAVVWTEGTVSSIINDKLEAITNANVYGKGTFVNKNYDSFDGREGINMQQVSSMYIEAKLVDGIDIWRDHAVHFDFANMDIIFKYALWKNKSMKFTNCRFLNGLRFPSFRNDGGNQIFKDCDFILPPYNTDDPKNKTTDIYDYKGELLFRIIFNGPNRTNLAAISPIDTSRKDNDSIINEVYNTYTDNLVLISPQVSCLMYSENTSIHRNNGNGRLEVRNSKLIIQKENCSAIILSKRKNSTTGEGHLIFDNVIIIDETTTKKSTALVTGWGDQATQQPELMINALSHNCETDHKLLAPNLNKWDITFNSIGDFVSKKNGGVFEGDVYFNDKLNLTPETIDVDHLSARMNIISKWGSWLNFIDGYSNDKYIFHNPNQGGRMELFIYDQAEKKPIFGVFTVQKTGNIGIGTTNPKEKLHINGGKIRIQTPTGYGDLGSRNTSWFHFETDRSNFYFNKGVHANGDIRLYQKDTYMRHSDGAIFENGVRVATQTWVNTALAGLVAANTKVSDADKLDGIDSSGFARQEIIPAKTLKIGWYTIATNIGNRASAKFVLRETRSGRHQSIHFYAAHNYGNGNVITVLSNSWHSGGGAIKNLRIKEASTYDGAVLQAYIDTDDAPVSGFIFEDIQSSGWTPQTWIPDATAPKGIKDYTKLTNIAATVNLDNTLGLNSSAEIFIQDKKVHREGAHLNLTDQELQWNKNTDGAAIGFKNTSDRDTDSYLYFKTTDNANEYFKWIHHQTRLEPVEWMQLKANALKVAGDIHANGTGYYGDNKKIIQFSDAWLRLNPSSQFTSGIYCGSKILRTDGELQVGGGGDKFKVDKNGNTTVYGNITGKSVDKKYSHLYKFGGIHFTWDSDTYGTNTQHAIRSTYGTSFGDSLTMNSFNHIRLNIDSNNNNANSRFEIGHNTSGTSNVIFSVDENGNTVASGNITAFSDRRLKKALKPVTESFLNKIDQLKPTFYQWKDKAKEQTEQLGFIAQEVMEVFPQWVHKSNEHYAVSYDKMGAVLAVKGIQELHKEIKALKAALKNLKHGVTN